MEMQNSEERDAKEVVRAESVSDSDEDPVEKASRKKKNRLNKLNDERLELALFSHQTP